MAAELDDAAFLANLRDAVDRLVSSSEANMRTLADTLEDEARRRAPVRTGRLRGSFKRRETKTDDGLTIDVINEAPYAAMVEFGTVDTQPQPFMRPAQDQARHSARSVLSR